MLTTKIELALNLHSVEDVKNAFYRYRKHFASDLEISDNETIFVIFKFPINIAEYEKEEILIGFNHEVVDCSLRRKISIETEVVRNLILANAFSNAPIGDNN